MHIQLLYTTCQCVHLVHATATSSCHASVHASQWRSPQVGGLPCRIVVSSLPSCLNSMRSSEVRVCGSLQSMFL